MVPGSIPGVRIFGESRVFSSHIYDFLPVFLSCDIVAHPYYQPRRVAPSCNPSGGWAMEIRRRCLILRNGCIEGRSLSKGLLGKGASPEGETSWLIVKREPAQAGDRASRIAPRTQWRDNRPECPAQILRRYHRRLDSRPFFATPARSKVRGRSYVRGAFANA